MRASLFWETRAQRFAAQGYGLSAVCSFSMPHFYNRAIDMTQRGALRGVLRDVRPGDRVLDFGCGIGRWSAEIARRGAQVTALDFSATMLAQAKSRIAERGLAERCRFVHGDISSFETAERFDLIFGVTVLQHILDDAQLAVTIQGLAAKLKPGGRLVMLEAAPDAERPACNTATFRARPLATYLAKVRDAGLTTVSIVGVDPAPFKLWIVPRFRSWPRPLALGALAAASLLALPIDLLFSGPLVRHSWHKIVTAVARGESP